MTPNPVSHALAALCLLALTPTINAHTWVEQLRLIASNGSYVGAPGYARGLIPRTGAAPGTGAADDNVHQLPAPPTKIDLMCKPAGNNGSQLLGVQSNNYPRLAAAATDHIALRYEENGHVSQIGAVKGKSLGRGVVYIYGTKVAQDTDTFLGIHGAWNIDGTGGDKRGKLLATRTFDDGRCKQATGTDIPWPLIGQRGQAANVTFDTEIFCQNDFQLPADMGTSGLYTLYWVWDWSTMWGGGELLTSQIYTSCMDIDVATSPVPNAGSFTAVQSGANANLVAIEDQMYDNFLVNPTIPLQVAPDDLNVEKPAGNTDSIKSPILSSIPASVEIGSATSASTNPPAASANIPDTKSTSAAQSSAARSSLAQSSQAAMSSTKPSTSSQTSAPKFITVTVDVPVIRTVTVTASGAAPSAAKPTTSSTTLAKSTKPSTTLQSSSNGAPEVGNSPTAFWTTLPITATVAAPSAPVASGGVYVSPFSSQSNSAGGAATPRVIVSTASGLYPTSTAVPSIKPFAKRAIRGMGWRI